MQTLPRMEFWEGKFTCFQCGKVGQLKKRDKRQKNPPPPEKVRCDTHKLPDRKWATSVLERDAAEEAARVQRHNDQLEGMRVLREEKYDKQRRDHVARIVKARPRPSPSALAAANATLTEQIKTGLRRDDVLTHGDGRYCPCNCGINLEAKKHRPAVLKTFTYLCGQTPARTHDICAVPKSWLEHAAASHALLHERYAGEIDPYAFIKLHALQRAERSPGDAAWYGDVAEAYDDHEGGRELIDELRVSVCAHDLRDVLLPFSGAKPDRDALGRIENATVGHSGYTISRFPVEMWGRKTVMTVIHHRRQMVLPAIDFHPVNDVWSPRMTAEFESLARLVVPATVHRLIKTSVTDGEGACAVVETFRLMYAPILLAIDALLRRKYQRPRAVLL